MRVFITGGTGLLGNNIIRQLSDRGDEILALVRRTPREEVFEGTRTEFAAGDLASHDVIDRCVAECDAVIHSAALIHLGWRREAESMLVNREGTRAIVDAAIRHNKRLVHIGTVNTLGLSSRDVIADEVSPLDHAGGQVLCNYVVSKRASVDQVREGVKRGLRAVVIHPGFMLGPWDWAPSSGRMLTELGRGWKPIYPTGGCSLCDVRDVAAGVITALERGGDEGRDYILAGVNWTYKQLWTEMCRRLGKPAPRIPVGPLVRVAAGRLGDLTARLLGREGDLNSASIRMSAQYHWHDSRRAREELGYHNRPPEQTLDDAVAFVQAHHPPFVAPRA